MSLVTYLPKGSKQFENSRLLNLPPSQWTGWAHDAQTRLEYTTSGGKDPEKIAFVFTTPTEIGPYDVGPGQLIHTVAITDPQVIQSVTGFVRNLQDKINAGLLPGFRKEFVNPER